NVEREAHRVPGKRAEVPHTCLPGPQEAMKRGVVAQFRMTNHLTVVIDCTGVVPRDPSCSAEVAEVMDRAVFFPEQGVIFHEVKPGIRVEWSASPRRADNL